MENFNLLLNKDEHILNKKTLEFTPLSRKDKNKKEVGRKDQLETFRHWDIIKWTALKERQINHAKLLCPVTSVPLELSPDYRLIVGLGNPSIYETSITLHHIYGFPYIPASAIKGVLRNYVINEFFQLNDEELAKVKKEDIGQAKEQKALKSSIDFCHIFGCPENSAKKNKDDKQLAFIGDIIFFDSFPTQKPNLEMDVMTVHYPKYYGEGTLPPADWQQPNPIPFLTLKNNPAKNRINKFQFIIGLRNGAENRDISIGNYKGKLVEITASLLFQALTNHGIGAKTAVGYGYFGEQK